MPRGKPVEIATRSFRTQTEADDFFKFMLGRYNVGERISPEDQLDLIALIERHPEYKMKVGDGVSHFTTMLTEHGTKCFRIERVDGTGTDVSYIHAVRGRPPSRKQEVTQAFRWAVRLDLFEARDRFFKENKDHEDRVRCAVTNERISRDEAHMDHLPPVTFQVIVMTFLAGKGMSFEDVPITAGRDEQVTAQMTDDALREDFRRWHKRLARLDIVKKSVNLSQASRNRLREGRISL